MSIYDNIRSLDSDDEDTENTVEFDDVVRKMEDGSNAATEEGEERSLDSGGGDCVTQPSKRRRIQPAALVWSDVDNFIPDKIKFNSSNAGIQDCFPVVDDDPESENHVEYFEAFYETHGGTNKQISSGHDI